MKKKNRILISNGTRTIKVSEKNLSGFLNNPANQPEGKAWYVVNKPKAEPIQPPVNTKQVFDKPQEEKPTPPPPPPPKQEEAPQTGKLSDERRKEMISELKKKGIKVHHATGDEKLTKIYNDEITS